MMLVSFFVMGAPGYHQFLTTASQGRTVPVASEKAHIMPWARLCAEAGEQRFDIHLFDGAVWRYKRSNVFHELMFIGAIGFVVLEDGSPDIQWVRETARALAPAPTIFLDARRADLTRMETITRTLRALLLIMFEDVDDSEFDTQEGIAELRW